MVFWDNSCIVPKSCIEKNNLAVRQEVRERTTDVFLMRNWDNVLLGSVFFVVEFTPIDHGKSVIGSVELLSGKVSQGGDETERRDAVIVEKTPSRLANGKGFFDAGRNGDTGGGRGHLLKMSVNHCKVTLIQTVVGQANLNIIPRMLTKLPKIKKSNKIV